MPYRGPQHLGEDAVDTFFQQRNIADDRAEREKLRAVQQQIQEAYLKLAEDSRARDNAESEQRMAMNRQAMSESDQDSAMKRATFEQGQADRSKAKQVTHDQNQVDIQQGVGDAYHVLREYPELAPEIKARSDVMAKLPSDEAKASWALMTTQTLHKRAQEIDIKRAESALNDSANQGGTAGIDGAPDDGMNAAIDQIKKQMNLFRESGGKEGVSGKDGLATYTKLVQEKAKNDGIAKARMMDSQELEAAWLPQAKGPQREQISAIIHAYARPHPGAPTYEQAIGAIQHVLAPQKQEADPEQARVKTQTGIFEALMRSNPDSQGDPQAAWEMAGKFAGSTQAPAAAGGQDPAAVAAKWHNDNPGATEEQFTAAMKKLGIGK